RVAQDPYRIGTAGDVNGRVQDTHMQAPADVIAQQRHDPAFAACSGQYGAIQALPHGFLLSDKLTHTARIVSAHSAFNSENYEFGNYVDDRVGPYHRPILRRGPRMPQALLASTHNRTQQAAHYAP